MKLNKYKCSVFWKQNITPTLSLFTNLFGKNNYYNYESDNQKAINSTTTPLNIGMVIYIKRKKREKKKA